MCLKTVNILQLTLRRNINSLFNEQSIIRPWFLCFTESVKARTIISNLSVYNNFVRSYSASANIESKIKTDSTPEGENIDLYSDINYNEITGSDENVLKKLKILMLEVEVMRQAGNKVPSRLKTENWKELLLLETRSARKRFLEFLFKNEMKRKNDEKKKTLKRLQIEERKAKLQEDQETNDHILYGFRGSTIFLRVYDTKIDRFYNNKLIQAMKFGQNLVVDCSYDNDMSAFEAKNCAKQLMLLFSDNRLHNDPFNLHFCNADPKSRVLTHLYKHIPTMYEPEYPLNITKKSYLDIFPKEKLVYLTPHCYNDLSKFNHDDIYIIGALVDKKCSDQLSLAKAKSEGIRMARLPLDKYLLWQIGSKSLSLDQMIRIMLDIRLTGNWPKAFVHVPRRKLIDRQSKSYTRPLTGIWKREEK